MADALLEYDPVTNNYVVKQAGSIKFGMNEGRKDDQDKDMWELLPPDALMEVTKVFTFGAKKYGVRNWELGMGWGRVFGAACRHLWAFWRGEENDPETGYSHLAHAGCCILFLLAYQLRKVGKDDRKV